MTLYRRLAVAATVVALAMVAVGATAGAETEPGSDLASYGLHANAPGLGLEGLYKDVALTVPETSSTLTTGGVGAGLASLAWPGPVVGNLGTTILVLEPAAPSQVTALNSPVRAEAHSAGPQKAGNDSVPGTVMASTATPDEVTATSRTGSTALPVGTFGVVSGASRVALTTATSAVATAESTVQDLTLAGGQVHIGAVRSSATATSDGQQAGAHGSTTVSGMTVAGVPVTVDGSGLHVAGQNVPNPVPQQTVDSAVKALGLTVLLTAPRLTRQGGSVSYDAGALVLVYTQSGKQYALTLGRAAVGIDASRAGVLPGLQVDLPVTAPADGPVAAGSGAPAVSGVAPLTAEPPTVPAPRTVSPVALGVAAALAPVALALAGGAPPLLTLGLLLLAGLLTVGLRALPDRVLTLPAVDCDERPS
ncbi:MAG: choice-of-anchor P family protein [Mycobacteriales bacterium]